MQKFLLCILSVIVVSSITFAQMKLQLQSEIVGEEIVSAENLALNKSETITVDNLPAKLPGDESKMIPGSFMVGLLGDVTFPFGEEFKNYAGTGWSVHGFGGYVLNPLILSMRVGYIRFGDVETDFGLLAKTSEINEIVTQHNTQLIIAFGLQFLIANLDPSCLGLIVNSGLQPYVAVALCLIFKNYFLSYINTLGINKLQKTTQFGDAFESSSTIFGVTPSIGTYYNVSEDIRLILSADYFYLFDKADEEISGSANISYLSLTFGGAYSF